MNTEGILQLLQLMDLAKQWPQLQPLHDTAMAELTEASDKARVELKKKADDRIKAEATARAKLEADRVAAAEAQQKKESDALDRQRQNIQAQAQATARQSGTTGARPDPDAALRRLMEQDQIDRPSMIDHVSGDDKKPISRRV